MPALRLPFSLEEIPASGTAMRPAAPRPLPPRGVPPSGSAAGYTLIELMTVVVLIGILAAMALPRLDSSAAEMDAAMQVLGSRLFAAQRSAVERQHDVVLAFDTAGRRVRIHHDGGTATNKSGANNGAVDTGEYVSWVPLEEGVVFGRGGAPAYRDYGTAHTAALSFAKRQNGMPALIFRRNGSTSERGVLYLTTLRAARSANRPQDARLAVIERATGRPTWYTYRSSQWQRDF